MRTVQMLKALAQAAENRGYSLGASETFPQLFGTLSGTLAVVGER